MKLNLALSKSSQHICENASWHEQKKTSEDLRKRVTGARLVGKGNKIIYKEFGLQLERLCTFGRQFILSKSG